VNDSLRLQARTARARIDSGELRGAALLELLLSIPARDRDLWIDEALGFDPPPPDVPDLPRGAVPYLPCGAHEIVAMVLEAPVRQEDEVVDLGSGVGRAAILAHLLSGARVSGVEIQEPLVRYARAKCAELALPDVAFVHADAAEISLDGSIFVLYAPFNGTMLRAVVRGLEQVARRRPIIVCAVGLELRDVPWLRPRTTSCASLAVYDSNLREA
jgi:SAM-dependent methyltransferase